MADHVFTMDLVPSGMGGCVLLDGEDISDLLRGVVVRSGVGQPTEIELQPGKGKRAQIVARLPEARITVADE